MVASTREALVIGLTPYDYEWNVGAPSTLLVDWENIKQPDCMVIKTHFDSVGGILADQAVTCERNPRYRKAAQESRCPYYWGVAEGTNPKQFPEAIAEVTKYCYDTGTYAIHRAILEECDTIYTIGIDMVNPDGSRLRYSGSRPCDTP